MKKRLRTYYLIVIDILLINLSVYLCFWLRFDGSIPREYLQIYLDNIFVFTVIKVMIFAAFKLYKSLWKYASIGELVQVVTGVITSNLVIIIYLFIKDSSFPRSIYILVNILDILLVGGSRLSYRTLRMFKNNELKTKSNKKRILIIGAGDAGAVVIKEIKNNKQLNSKPVAILDDDEKKEGKRIYGVPVLGQRFDITSIVRKKKIDEIIIAIPSANKYQLRDIIEECKKTKCKLKTLPGIYELIDGKVTIKEIRDVEIEDLLGREQVELNIEDISWYLTDKKILVTGGGGSIGSELCRQIVEFRPKELVILDINENNVYDIENELKGIYSGEVKRNGQVESNGQLTIDNGQLKDDGEIKGVILRSIIASVRDRVRMDEVIDEIRPDIIFHAAAHKHVPLMEKSPKEAIKNNVLGTLNVVEAADKYKVKKFVLISTDKAVNPTSIMGASKRICEMIVQSINNMSKTDFVAVRFGNVLGSNGSVIPLFKKQIGNGGPVTVTHEDVIRYFMTISEAAQLVIQASAMAGGGEIFVLDMGEPVKILNLAEDLISLSGFEPYKDIDIKITGLRPGEKLFEELLLDEEGIKRTSHKKIFIAKPMFIDYNILTSEIEKLKEILLNRNDEDVKKYIEKIVPTYKKNLSK